jgi:hypothetical protein
MQNREPQPDLVQHVDRNPPASYNHAMPVRQEGRIAADLKMARAISYEDASAAALAARTDAILVSGDPEFDQLQGRVQLEKLHRAREPKPV